MKRGTILLLLSIIAMFQSCRSGVDPELFTVSDFSPKSGPIGEIVTIHGGGFATDSISVFLDSVQALILKKSLTEITVLIPETGKTNKLTVKLNSTASVKTSTEFTVTSGFSFYPRQARRGEIINIYCAEMLNGHARLRIGNEYMPLWDTTSTSVKCMTPLTPGKYQISFLTKNGWIEHHDQLEVLGTRESYSSLEVSLDSVIGLFSLHDYTTSPAIMKDSMKAFNSTHYSLRDSTKHFTADYFDVLIDFPYTDSIQGYVAARLQFGGYPDTIRRCFLKKVKQYSNDHWATYCFTAINHPIIKTDNEMIVDLKGDELIGKLIEAEYSESGFDKSNPSLHYLFDKFEISPNTHLQLKLSR